MPVVGIACRKLCEDSKRIGLKIVSFLRSKKYTVLVERKYADFLGLPGVDWEVLDEEADDMIVVGGDGTFLEAVYRLKNSPRKRFLGVRLVPSLGFLTSTCEEKLEEDLERYVRGEFFIEKRRRVRVSVHRESCEFLNEVVIRHRDFRKIIGVRVLEQRTGEEILKGRMDALLVSTSTGSTAYALSAGGPIVDPDLDIWVIAPVAPLSPLLRPVVLPSQKEIVVEVYSGSGVIIGDGLAVIEFPQDSKVEISPGSYVNLIRFRRDFYTRLSERLKCL